MPRRRFTAAAVDERLGKDAPCELRVSGLSVSYAGVRALREMTFTVRHGEAVALVGRNGAGKTSTLQGIMRFGGRVTGSVVLESKADSVDLSRAKTYEVARAGVTLVPDSRRLFPRLEIGDILRLCAEEVVGRKAAAERVDWVLDLVPAVVPWLDRKRGELSGGQQQLVAIARGLAMRPRVLLLDEPSEGLSPVARQDVLEVVLNLKRATGMAMVVAEQNIDFALALADSIVGLVSGSPTWTKDAEAFRQDRTEIESVVAL